MKSSALRTRWAAVGAAVAVSLGAGGVGISQAVTDSGERAIYAPLDEPCRLADNRPGGIGPETSVTFDGWGMVGDCDLPTGTSGLALNVTAVDATQQTNLRFYPADVAVPATANLNPTPGAPPLPNAVNVGLDAAGQFKVFNKFGTVAVIIDVMGVYDDHNHDDRYYQKSDVDAALADKADADDIAGVEYSFTGDQFNLANTYQVLESIVVDAPEPGLLLVTGSTAMNTLGTAVGVRCGLTDVATAVSPNTFVEFDGGTNFAETRGFEVAAGETTIYLICRQEVFGTDPVIVGTRSMTAVFSSNRI